MDDRAGIGSWPVDELRPTPITVGFDNIALSQRERQSTTHMLTNREGTGYVPNGLVGLIKLFGPRYS